MRHLAESDVARALRSGGEVEQFLPPREEGGYRALSWVCVKKDRDGTFSISRYDVFDEGDLDHLDLYSFSYINPDEPHESRSGLPSAEMALIMAEEQFGATRIKYVNAGIIQDEYADFLRTQRATEAHHT